MSDTFQGVYAVPCTAFSKDGEIDEQAMRRHLRFIVDDGKVHGIIPIASAGEFAFLSEEERRRVVSITLSEVAGVVPVVPGATGVSTREAIAYAQFAQEAGADGVMVLSPYYGHPDQEELYYHFRAVAESIDIPVMLYNNPASGADMLPSTVARLAEIDNISGIKESTCQMQRVAEIMRLSADRIEILCGCDTLAMEMFTMGVQGWVAAPTNVVPRQCVELYDLVAVKRDFESGWALYSKLLPLFTMFEESGKNVQLAKAALEMMGRPIGLPRRPLMPVSEENRKALKKALDAILE
jgi:4-hydroxy-tetrahydrodipicolinate synthase